MLESLFLLLPISIFFVLLIGVALWWAIFSGQFDDLNSAGKSILLDDDSTLDETGNESLKQELEHDSEGVETKIQTVHPEPK